MKFTGERIVPSTKECANDTLIYKQHFERYKFASKFTTNKIVLDIACGVGYGSKFIAELGAKKVYARDLSDEAIKYAKENYYHKIIDYDLADICNLTEFKNEFFDCVICFETIEHIQSAEKAFSEMKRILKPNGILIISTPNGDKSIVEDMSSNFHYQEFTFTEFKKFFKNYNVEYYSQSEKKPKISIPLKKSLTRKIIPVKLRKKYLSSKNRLPEISEDEYIIKPLSKNTSPLLFIAKAIKPQNE